jgi:ubiquitin-like protein Pup
MASARRPADTSSMTARIHEQATHRKRRAAASETSSPEARTSNHADGVKNDIDELLDEIDEVLEENAEEFVKSYVQKGGE